MSRVHLIEGPVGAGKSTFGAALAASSNGVHIPLDEWFATLFSPDRPGGDFVPWYVERKERLLGLIWNHSRRVLASGRDVVLELGLIQQQQRIQFCRMITNEGFPPHLHVLDAPLEIRRARVRRRNEERGPTFSMVVPDHVFEMASKLWESPDEFECEECEVSFVTEGANASLDG
ncbi:AAA family ATPase [Delftia tsuruhatensis]|uniref:AAA family ATPase n=1 Tax=Delftia tsuruhatensis TaxID=180282 RepID=UPI002AD58F1D|nr:AAA family ATPase [Delftia tsuruhatensis]WQM85961.1 AAA family ATPase [Delftia tsuruhatensis]